MPADATRRLSEAPAHRAAAQAPNGGERILIVEDEYLVAIQVEESLANAGFQVVGVARTANEAVELAKAKQPALVVMDIRLAGECDGVDAAIEIYNETGIRCVFATAYADRETRLRAGPAAPLGWLAKPYRMSALIELIREALTGLGSRR